MALKTYNPVTPGQRQLVLVDRFGLYTGAPVKALTEGKNRTGGRNNSGSITSRYRGGGPTERPGGQCLRRRIVGATLRMEQVAHLDRVARIGDAIGRHNPVRWEPPAAAGALCPGLRPGALRPQQHRLLPGLRLRRVGLRHEQLSQPGPARL